MVGLMRLVLWGMVIFEGIGTRTEVAMYRDRIRGGLIESSLMDIGEVGKDCAAAPLRVAEWVKRIEVVLLLWMEFGVEHSREDVMKLERIGTDVSQDMGMDALQLLCGCDEYRNRLDYCLIRLSEMVLE